MGDGIKVLVVGCGTVEFALDGKVVHLPDVFHVPNLNVILLFIRLHWCCGAS